MGSCESDELEDPFTCHGKIWWKSLGLILPKQLLRGGVCPLLVLWLVLALVCWCFELTTQCYGVFVFPIKTQTEGPYSPVALV